MRLIAADRQPSYSWKHSYDGSIDGSDRELAAYQQSTLKYEPADNQQFPYNWWNWEVLRLRLFDLFKGVAALLLSLIAFSYICFTWSFTFSRNGILESRFTLFTSELWHFFVFFYLFCYLLWLLLFEEAFMKVMKLSVSIPEADSLRILESIREVSFDRSMVDLQKIMGESF